MRLYLTIIMALCEGAMAVSFARERQWLLAVTWLGYTIAVIALGMVNQR